MMATLKSPTKLTWATLDLTHMRNANSVYIRWCCEENSINGQRTRYGLAVRRAHVENVNTHLLWRTLAHVCTLNKSSATIRGFHVCVCVDVSMHANGLLLYIHILAGTDWAQYGPEWITQSRVVRMRRYLWFYVHVKSAHAHIPTKTNTKQQTDT